MCSRLLAVAPLHSPTFVRSACGYHRGALLHLCYWCLPCRKWILGGDLHSLHTCHVQSSLRIRKSGSDVWAHKESESAPVSRRLWHTYPFVPVLSGRHGVRQFLCWRCNVSFLSGSVSQRPHCVLSRLRHSLRLRSARRTRYEYNDLPVCILVP